MQRRSVVKLIALLTILCLIMLATACSSEPPTPSTMAGSPVPTSSGTEQPTTPPAGSSSQIQAVEGLATMVAQRTPVPTPTPGPVGLLVEEMAIESGLAGQRFLGIWTKDWIDLGVSLLFALVGILLGVYLLFGMARWAVRRTKTRFDDDFLECIGGELRWLVVVILTRLAVLRLNLWGDGVRILLEDLFFLLSFVLLYIIALRLVAFAAEWYQDHRVPEANRKRLAPIAELLKRLGYLLVSVFALSIALSYFGINITGLSAVVVLVVVVIAVAAKAAIDDAISGLLILIDRPFRVGDDIFLKELNTWGKVMAIGIRITRIRPLDNREVTIPNSLIGQSQVVNYSYPDPSFRIRTDISVAFGTDSARLQDVVEGAVREVEGVLPDKPVDVIFRAFGDSGRQVRVQWWIDDVNHQDRVLNRVNAAIEQALDEAGIKMPFQTYDLNLNTGKIGYGGVVHGEEKTPG